MTPGVGKFKIIFGIGKRSPSSKTFWFVSVNDLSPFVFHGGGLMTFPDLNSTKAA